MNIIERIIRPAAICFIAFNCSNNAVAQDQHEVRPVSVSLRVVAKGTTQYYQDQVAGYFVEATVTNVQDTAIAFWIMECSWPDINWSTSNSSISFGTHGCDANPIEKIVLLPHRSMSFYGFLRPNGKVFNEKQVKLGFVYFETYQEIFDAAGSNDKRRTSTKYWSNEVVLKDNLFTYKMD